MIGDVRKFRFWCQKVLPLVYDDSLSYYEVLCKVVQYLNKVIEDVNSIPEYIDNKIEEALTDEHIVEILSQFIAKVQRAISANNEGTNTNASKDYAVGEMLWLNDTLYKVIRTIDTGATFIVGTNIEAVDFETLFNDFVDEVKHDITANDDGTSATATQSWLEGQWLWLNDNLYEVLSDITTGNAYVFSGADANVKEITVEEMLVREQRARVNADAVFTDAINNLNNTVIPAINNNLDNINNTEIPAINSAIQALSNNAFFVSPRKYGAAGDGVTDDTEAVQECIDNNAYIVFDGDFYITDTITLHSNLFIMGNGGIVNPSETTSLYGDDVENVIIKDISFTNGERSGSFGSTGNINIINSTNIIIDGIKDNSNNKKASILFDRVSYFEIRNCIIKDSGYSGILCPGNCHYGNIHHNTIIVSDYTQYINSYAIAMSFYPNDVDAPTDRSNECTNIIIDSNYIETSLGHWEGIDCHGGQYIDIVNNTIKGFYDGIALTYGNYSSLNVAPKNIKISGNLVYGPAALSSARTDCYGISCFGNDDSGELNITISNNMIKDVYALVNNVGVGNGVFIRGLGITLSDNSFFGKFKYAIHMNNLGRAVINNNVGNNVNASFIAIDNITQSVRIDDNVGHRIANFYEIVDATGVSNIQRSGNEMNGGYWMNNEYDVTDVSVFVPDYCKASPVGSAYHPLNAVALKAIPASGSPRGWIANGSTWLAMPNLT